MRTGRMAVRRLNAVLANPLLDLMAFHEAAQAEVNQSASRVEKKDFHSDTVN